MALDPTQLSNLLGIAPQSLEELVNDKIADTNWLHSRRERIQWI